MSLYKSFLRPILFKTPPETAHELGIEALKLGLGSKPAREFAAEKFACGEFGELPRFNLKFKNPLGVAAGFDKNGAVVNQLAALGFGFVEVGTITFKAQTGNQKPRLFRLPEDNALINRLGFNNDGAPKIVERLKKINPACVLGVNIGKNKNVPNDDAVENYLQSFDLAFEVADYIAVNVSSPNTPNLRELQKAENLEELLGALQNRNRVLSFGLNSRNENNLQISSESETKNIKPLLVKIAPDLNESEIEAVVDVCLRLEISGVIATNTTTSRANLRTSEIKIKSVGAGGLSGEPLLTRSNQIIRKIYKHSKGKLPIIGVGGIFSPEDAFKKIASGACLLQSYTGFIYNGVTFARDVNFGLAQILREKGFRNLDEAVGAHVKTY